MQDEKDHCRFNPNHFSFIESKISELFKLMGVSLASNEFPAFNSQVVRLFHRPAA